MGLGGIGRWIFPDRLIFDRIDFVSHGDGDTINGIIDRNPFIQGHDASSTGERSCGYFRKAYMACSEKGKRMLAGKNQATQQPQVNLAMVVQVG